MRKLLDEYRMFGSQPRPMRMLLLTNMVYAFALPIIELLALTSFENQMM